VTAQYDAKRPDNCYGNLEPFGSLHAELEFLVSQPKKREA